MEQYKQSAPQIKGTGPFACPFAHFYDHSFPLRSKAQKGMKPMPLAQQVELC
jgi:hypothetical protein